MRTATKTQAMSAPDTFIITNLYADRYELTANDAADKVEMQGMEEGKAVTCYEYNTYSAMATVKSYEEMVAALIDLRYSVADEIALSRKSDEDTEVLVYLAYVAECKTAAKKYYGMEE